MAKQRTGGEPSNTPNGLQMGLPGVGSPFKGLHKGPQVSLGDLDESDLVRALDAVLDVGALVSMGRTSDQGAIGVYVTYKEMRFKDWAGDMATLEAIMSSLHDWAVSLGS